jgi:hypothetical protein
MQILAARIEFIKLVLIPVQFPFSEGGYDFDTLAEHHDHQLVNCNNVLPTQGYKSTYRGKSTPTCRILVCIIDYGL